eukprot:COSAG02_NODE_2057_length_9978_cov_8.030874_1_plen_68_part_10
MVPNSNTDCAKPESKQCPTTRHHKAPQGTPIPARSKFAADRIVKADIRKAQEAGLDYEAFRGKYRPVG